MRPSLCVFAAIAVSAFSLIGCSSSDDGGIDSNAAQVSEEQDGGAAKPGVDACADLPSGPFQPTAVFRPFSGSEDFAFDGQGNIVARRGNEVVRVDAQGQATSVAAFGGQVYGLRYHPNGNLIAALPASGALITIGPAGELAVFATGLGTPNGVYVDFDGTVWVTEFGANKVTRIGPDQTRESIVTGPEFARTANGVVVDAARNVLFYTESTRGKIRRVDLTQRPRSKWPLSGAALDGITLDACGNIYAVDQGSSRIFRVRLDASGVATAPPELLASFPANVANAQFGSGPGFDADKLYVTGNPGVVFSIPVGVRGAAVPAPPQPKAPGDDDAGSKESVDGGEKLADDGG